MIKFWFLKNRENTKINNYFNRIELYYSIQILLFKVFDIYKNKFIRKPFMVGE